jgi:hypothetical protein
MEDMPGVDWSQRDWRDELRDKLIVEHEMMRRDGEGRTEHRLRCYKLMPPKVLDMLRIKITLPDANQG